VVLRGISGVAEFCTHPQIREIKTIDVKKTIEILQEIFMLYINQFT
jgi:hypothetical protein